jgi:hypothetical protein
MIIDSLKALDQGQLTWLNKPAGVAKLSGDGLRIMVPGRTDYFQDPAGIIHVDSAPYLCTDVNGDFAARAHVRHAFQTVYDAGAIMVRQDALHWAKLCFESTDIGTRAVVSVITNGTSDDANGVNVNASDIWLQLVRKANLFAMHYSVDGHTWCMARLFHLALTDPLQVGLVAQCPVGTRAVIDWLSFEVASGLPANIRAGV